MNEPKKSLIEFAARRKWPTNTGIVINQRKHTMIVYFGKQRLASESLSLSANSHRELLEQITK